MTDDRSTRTDRHTARQPTDPRSGDRHTLADVDHTPPGGPETSQRLFGRGPEVAADGGRPRSRTRTDEDDEERAERDGHREGASDEESGADPDRETLADVDHTPPDGEGADRVWERGGESGSRPPGVAGPEVAEE